MTKQTIQPSSCVIGGGMFYRLLLLLPTIRTVLSISYIATDASNLIHISSDLPRDDLIMTHHHHQQQQPPSDVSRRLRGMMTIVMNTTTTDDTMVTGRIIATIDNGGSNTSSSTTTTESKEIFSSSSTSSSPTVSSQAQTFPSVTVVETTTTPSMAPLLLPSVQVPTVVVPDITTSSYPIEGSPTTPPPVEMAMTVIDAPIKIFTTLTCNSDIDMAPCQSWTTLFGTFNVYTTIVTIPCGTCVTMDYNRVEPLELLGGIDIHGKLVFPEENSSNEKSIPLTITTTMMIVQGELSMTTSTTKPINGQPAIRIQLIGQDVNQTFTPVDSNANACHNAPTCTVGKKAIVVAGGKVNIRGIPPNSKTWTRLYDVAGFHYSHPDTIYLEDSNIKDVWSVGAEIIITSHTLFYNDTQVRTIIAVSASPVVGYSAYTLNTPIVRPTTILESPDMAVEVALLSRNIVFEGGSDTTVHHGGHLMIYHTPTIVQVIEGIEIINFGQQGTIGRYPIHFHFCDDVPGSIVSKNTIRQSNQRCVVVHATNKLRIEENVAYATKGHCYMTEDGIEKDNEFTRNLGASTDIPAVLIGESVTANNGIETDDSPSTFWISNPENYYIGNVAAGSKNSGFWFEPKVRGVRASLYIGYNPLSAPMGAFKDNVVHSCHSREGAIQTYTPGYRPTTMVTLDGIKSYRNFIGIEIHRCQNIIVANSFFADNIVNIDIDRAEGIEVVNTTIIGESDSYRKLIELQPRIQQMCDITGRRIGIDLHTWKVESAWAGAKISNVSLVGFDKTGTCSKAASIKYDTQSLKQGMFEFYTAFQSMTIGDGPNSVNFCIVNEDEFSMVYTIDLDGSMKPSATTQIAGASTLIGSDDGRLLQFVDKSKCTMVVAGCYSYCAGICFRSMRFELDVPKNEIYSLKVCLRNNYTQCTSFNGGRRVNGGSYTLIAHVPVGNEYDATFLNTNGMLAKPSFTQRAEESFCSVESVFDVAIVDGGIGRERTPRARTPFQKLFDFLARFLQLFL